MAMALMIILLFYLPQILGHTRRVQCLHADLFAEIVKHVIELLFLLCR